jgi:HEAT repeat protein
VARLTEKLGRRFWASYQRDGAARQLHFPREQSPDIRNLLALLVTTLQIVRPESPSPQWNATERDSAGTYLATYHQPRPTELVKQKLRYLSIDGDGSGGGSGAGGSSTPAAIQIVDARSHFTFDGHGVVTGAEVRERTVVDTKLGSPGFEIELRVVLGKLRAGDAPDLVGSLERARPAVDTSPVVTQRESEDVLRARQDARLIEGVTLGPLLKEVHGRETEMHVRAQLAALLRRRPRDVPEALAFARQAEVETARVVLAALGHAQTPAAQEALGTLASDATRQPALRTAALQSIVQARRPTPSTLSWLVKLLDDPDPAVKKHALYLTGAAGAACRDTDPAGAARIEAELLRRSRACSEASCIDVLIALGNLATDGALPAIEAALASPNPRVRAAAARALGRIALPTADRLIVATMTTDRDSGVRAAAVTAAGSRPIAPLAETLSTLMRTDPAESVRTSAIRVAGAHIEQAPQLEQALLAAASGDPSPGLQRLARKALGSRFPASATASDRVGAMR